MAIRWQIFTLLAGVGMGEFKTFHDYGGQLSQERNSFVNIIEELSTFVFDSSYFSAMLCRIIKGFLWLIISCPLLLSSYFLPISIRLIKMDVSYSNLFCLSLTIIYV